MATQTIAILGAGKIGQAIGALFVRDGYEVAYWDVRTNAVRGQVDLRTALANAKAVFVCVPSTALRSVLKKSVAHLRKDQVVVSVSKGLEKASGKSVDVILSEVLPEHIARGVMCGPMLADEMKHFGCATLGMRPGRARRKIELMFAGTSLHLNASNDVRGVAMSGVLKNCYSLGLGMCAELGYGNNFSGWYIVQALNEMRSLIVRLGGREETVMGLAGLGDLIATGTSEASKNVQAGKELIATGQLISSEGVRSIALVRALLGKQSLRYPLLLAVYNAAKRPAKAKDFFAALLDS